MEYTRPLDTLSSATPACGGTRHLAALAGEDAKTT